MGKEENIWYAVNTTRVILPPRQTLETFGATTIRYFLVSELMDEVRKVRVREGRVVSERPQIITPSHLADRLLEGFGEKAQDYANWLRDHNEMVRILQYGLQFRKDEISQEVVSDDLESASSRVVDHVKSLDEALTAVLIGADEMWEVSLLKFVVDYIEHSAPANINDINQRAREEANFQSARLRDEIEADFRRAAEDRTYVQVLGDKLQRLGLFEKYEDRFFDMVHRGN